MRSGRPSAARLLPQNGSVPRSCGGERGCVLRMGSGPGAPPARLRGVASPTPWAQHSSARGLSGAPPPSQLPALRLLFFVIHRIGFKYNNNNNAQPRSPPPPLPFVCERLRGERPPLAEGGGVGGVTAGGRSAVLSAPTAAAGGVGMMGTEGGGSALLMPSWWCLGPGGGIWGRICMDGGCHPLLFTVPGWGRERQRVGGGGWGGTAGCAVPPLCLETRVGNLGQEQRWVFLTPPPPACCFPALSAGGGGAAARCDPILQRTPEMGGGSGGWGERPCADPTASRGMAAVGSGGVPRTGGDSRVSSGLQTAHSGAGPSHIPGVGTVWGSRSPP